jgi:hypothetical protein
MLTAVVCTTIATSSPTRMTSLEVSPTSATKGFVSPVAAAA